MREMRSFEDGEVDFAAGYGLLIHQARGDYCGPQGLFFRPNASDQPRPTGKGQSL